MNKTNNNKHGENSLCASDERSARQVAMSQVVGTRVVKRDGQVLIEPAMSAKAVYELDLAVRPQDEGAALHLYQSAGLSKEQVRLFESTRKIIRMPRADGGRVAVVPHIPGVDDDDLDAYSQTDDGESQVGVITEEKRKYQLSAFFSDMTVADKFGLSHQRVQTLKRLAVVDPVAAAASLTEVLNHRGYPNYRVFAGDYSKSIARYREVIHQHASRIKYTDPSIAASVTAEKIQLQFDEFGKEPVWSVIAPLKHAVEAQCIYQLAVQHGPEHIMCLLGLEVAALRILIYDEQRREYISSELQGYSSLDGIEPIGVIYPATITPEQKSRLTIAASKLEPVVSSENRVVGTAVRVSDRHVLINTHTVTQAFEADVGLSVSGTTVQAMKVVADDLSVMQLRGNGTQWPLRDAMVGEEVVLCYHVGANVEFSEILRVRAVTNGSLQLSHSDILRPGASGAAVVALRDFAFLGMFVTMNQMTVRCSVFSSDTLWQVIDADSVASSEVNSREVGAGEATYNHMIRHGLRTFMDAVYESVDTVSDISGNQVGISVRYHGSMITSVPPATIASIESGVVVDGWEQVGAEAGLWRTKSSIGSQLPNVRKPSDGEHVFVFNKAHEDVVMSTIVKLTLAEDGKFLLAGIENTEETLLHGLVLSAVDGACLGHITAAHADAFGNSVYHGYVAYMPDPNTPSNDETLLQSVVKTSTVNSIMIADADSQEIQSYALMGKSLLNVAHMDCVMKGQTDVTPDVAIDRSAEFVLRQVWYDVFGHNNLPVRDYWRLRYEALVGFSYTISSQLAHDLCIKVLFEEVESTGLNLNTPKAAVFPRA